MATVRRRISQKGVSLFLGTLSLVMVVPAAGLAVDVGMLYVTKARLQGAVDGSALAAARALNLGSTITAQETSAKQNAVNWFYANFPTNNWATTGTQMDTTDTHVHVYPDTTYPALEHVDVNASTIAPTYFMKWFGFGGTTVAATGNASRRDVVIMIVLDRSSSMSTASCTALKDAAKLFVGQFAVGRDQIGLVSFSDGTYVHQSPTTDFRNQLGYTYGSTTGNGSGNHAIGSISCQGATSSPQALMVAYNELYKVNLAGALNLILFETDGLPNTLNMDWHSNLSTTSTCKDTGNHTYAAGWHSNEIPNWTTGYTLNPTGFTGYQSNVPSGAIAALYSSDPANGQTFTFLYNPYHSSGNQTTTLGSGTLTGCSNPGVNGTAPVDVGTTIPATDVWGNSLVPSSHAYQTVTTTGGLVNFSGTNAQKWTNYHNAVLNATDNAAHRIRSNATLPATIYAIGLEGSSGNAPDITLLQRVTNDPTADTHNSTAEYTTCATTTNCYIWPNEPQGRLIMSTDHSQLASAFGALASQILRLSQ
ncbi:MAG TPA: VWA domain-containing protein [Bryobacteraceae bacterium]|jgi:hypothetical protein